MDSSDGAVDHELRQERLSRFGRVLACVTLVYVAVNFVASVWLHRLAFNLHSVNLVVAAVAFAALWLPAEAPPHQPSASRSPGLTLRIVVLHKIRRL